MNIFTNDQKTRILTVLQNSSRRKELLESDVCTATNPEVKQATKLLVKPNPAREKLEVSLNQDSEEPSKEYTLSIYTSCGKLIKSFKTDLSVANEISVYDLSAGLYFLNASTATFSTTVKFVKM
jgi:hypothetical protein